MKMNIRIGEGLERGGNVKIFNTIFPKGIEGIVQSVDFLNGVVEVTISDDMYIVTFIENVELMKGENE